MECWRLRCRGWPEWRIGKHLGITQQAVNYHLKKAREQHKLDTEAYIVEYVGQLDAMVEQGFDSWHKSLEPQRRARQTTDADGNEVTVNEAIEREGSTHYLTLALAALDRKAKVLGLNVADAPQEPFTVSSLAAEVDERGKAYEQRADPEAPSPVDPGQRAPDPGTGTGEVPQGPGPVQ